MVSELDQKEICTRYGVPPSLVTSEMKLGISRDFDSSMAPINGLRHPPEGDACGWYIWSGTVFSDAPDFFVPICASRLTEMCPELLKLLGLPPGWRFLLAPGYEDVWYDEALLNLS